MKTYQCQTTGKWIAYFTIAGVTEEAAAREREQAIHLAIERMR